MNNGRKICNICLDKQKESKVKKIKNGYCVSCSNKHLNGIASCFNCRLKNAAKNSMGSKKYSDSLLEKLKSQNYKCESTGKHLIPGNNASIDHIIPTSKGGTNDISNIRWVWDKINLFKWDDSKEEADKNLEELRLLLNKKYEERYKNEKANI